MTWDPPVDTGGAPLTQFGVRIDGKRVAVPADARSAVISGVRAGPREAKVRAFNQVAVSGWTPLPVAVPAYPSVAGPTRVKKGTTVTLRFAGLLPNQPTTHPGQDREVRQAHDAHDRPAQRRHRDAAAEGAQDGAGRGHQRRHPSAVLRIGVPQETLDATTATARSGGGRRPFSAVSRRGGP